jgi:hypothetical protein
MIAIAIMALPLVRSQIWRNIHAVRELMFAR